MKTKTLYDNCTPVPLLAHVIMCSKLKTMLIHITVSMPFESVFRTLANQ